MNIKKAPFLFAAKNVEDRSQLVDDHANLPKKAFTGQHRDWMEKAAGNPA